MLAQFSYVKHLVHVVAWAAVVFGGVLGMSSMSKAGVWDSAVGDARAVQRKTEDIAERLNEDFPYSQASRLASLLDNTANRLLNSIKCGAPWEQVQGLLSQTGCAANDVNALVLADCNVRNDRRTRDYLTDLAKRLERLHSNLDRCYGKLRPEFCQPIYRVERPSWGAHAIPRQYPHQHELDPFAGREAQPWPKRPQETYPNEFPRDTYEFDRRPFEARPEGFDAVPPSSLPPGSQIGPIEYRIQNRAPQSRGALITQIGIEALRMALENR
jgi:hypothetical protein